MSVLTLQTLEPTAVQNVVAMHSFTSSSTECCKWDDK
ncbi:class III lanthipeptide [Streptomyces sp. IBSBF 2435]